MWVARRMMSSPAESHVESPKPRTLRPKCFWLTESLLDIIWHRVVSSSTNFALAVITNYSIGCERDIIDDEYGGIPLRKTVGGCQTQHWVRCSVQERGVVNDVTFSYGKLLDLVE